MSSWTPTERAGIVLPVVRSDVGLPPVVIAVMLAGGSAASAVIAPSLVVAGVRIAGLEIHDVL